MLCNFINVVVAWNKLKFRVFIQSSITKILSHIKISIMSINDMFDHFLEELTIKYKLPDLKEEYEYYIQNGYIKEEKVNHSPGICKAKTVKGKNCTNKSKEIYDGYCGVHKKKGQPNKPSKSHKSPPKFHCGGKTKKGIPCKKTGIYEGFCLHHSNNSEEGIVLVKNEEEKRIDEEERQREIKKRCWNNVEEQERQREIQKRCWDNLEEVEEQQVEGHQVEVVEEKQVEVVEEKQVEKQVEIVEEQHVEIVEEQQVEEHQVEIVEEHQVEIV
jgi:hypothetical protein